MADQIGYSREIPLAGAAGPGGGASQVAGISPQEAVKIFSLRVPERPSQGAIAPLPLLTSQGSAAPGAAGLGSILSALAQAMSGRGITGGQTGVTAPMVPSPLAGTSANQFSVGASGPANAVFQSSGSANQAPPPPHVVLGENGSPQPGPPTTSGPGAPISSPLPPTPPPAPLPLPSVPASHVLRPGVIGGGDAGGGAGPTLNPRFAEPLF